jgi:hypothetical protein
MLFEVGKKGTSTNFFLVVYDMAYINLPTLTIKTDDAFKRILGELGDKTKKSVTAEMEDNIDVLLDDETIVEE